MPSLSSSTRHHGFARPTRRASWWSRFRPCMVREQRS